MKFLSLIALFSAAALAAKYEPGTPCHTNDECNKNCIAARWTITHDDGDYYLACDTKTMNPTYGYRGTCDSLPPGSGHPKHFGALKSGPFPDAKKTEEACTAVGGKNCRGGCVVTAKRSSDGDTRASWDQACKATNSPSRTLKQYANEVEANVNALCEEASNPTM